MSLKYIASLQPLRESDILIRTAKSEEIKTYRATSQLLLSNIFIRGGVCYNTLIGVHHELNPKRPVKRTPFDAANHHRLELVDMLPSIISKCFTRVHPPRLPLTNTTRTAAYAAQAPNTSDLLALVKRPIQIAKATV